MIRLNIAIKDKYEGVYSGEMYTVSDIHVGEDGIVKVELTDTLGETGLSTIKDISSYYKKVSKDKPQNTQQNINQDIVNLIGLGYQFKSFTGNTLDNRAFYVDLET